MALHAAGENPLFNRFEPALAYFGKDQRALIRELKAEGSVVWHHCKADGRNASIATPGGLTIMLYENMSMVSLIRVQLRDVRLWLAVLFVVLYVVRQRSVA